MRIRQTPQPRHRHRRHVRAGALAHHRKERRMSDEKSIAPRSWKDMKEPMPLEDYAAQRMREQAEQPADLSPLGEFPWETVYASFEPAQLHDRFHTTTRVASPGD